MSLPKSNLPISTFIIPSSGSKINMRPMKVSDEKILLAAKETKNPNEFYLAVKQIINNCTLDENFNVNNLAIFDIDFLFIKLRSISIGKTIDVTYLDYDDNQEYVITIDLDTVTITEKENNKEIKIGENILLLKYPQCTLYESPVFQKEDVTQQELFEELVVGCLEKYWFEDKFIEIKDYKPQEIKDFVNDLDLKTYEKIKEFIAGIPTLFHETKYTNSKGQEKTITSTSLSDFFTFA